MCVFNVEIDLLEICELFDYVNKMHLLFIYFELIRHFERWDRYIRFHAQVKKKRVFVKMPETDWQHSDNTKRICSATLLCVCAFLCAYSQENIWFLSIIDSGSNVIGGGIKWFVWNCARFVYRIVWLKHRWHGSAENTLTCSKCRVNFI